MKNRVSVLAVGVIAALPLFVTPRFLKPLNYFRSSEGRSSGAARAMAKEEAADDRIACAGD